VKNTEFNLAENAEAMANQGHPGYEQTALDGISLSLKAINDKRIKIVVNGGALNPKGLAEAVVKLVSSIRRSRLAITGSLSCRSTRMVTS
jgi:hypothetical protein